MFYFKMLIMCICWYILLSKIMKCSTVSFFFVNVLYLKLYWNYDESVGMIYSRALKAAFPLSITPDRIYQTGWKLVWYQIYLTIYFKDSCHITFSVVVGEKLILLKPIDLPALTTLKLSCSWILSLWDNQAYKYEYYITFDVFSKGWIQSKILVVFITKTGGRVLANY